MGVCLSECRNIDAGEVEESVFVVGAEVFVGLSLSAKNNLRSRYIAYLAVASINAVERRMDLSLNGVKRIKY